MPSLATSPAAGSTAAHAYLAQAGAWTPAARPCRYWPCDLLSAFILQMAAQGCCVNESMMLGSRAYAVEQLSHAHTLDDALLREMAVRMFSYFDDEPVHAVSVLVGQSLPH